MNDRQPLAGEGQVTINTKLRHIPATHPSFMKRLRRAELHNVADEIERLRSALTVIKRFPFPEAEVKKTATTALESMP